MLRPGHILSVLNKMLFTFNFVIVQAHERVSLGKKKNSLLLTFSYTKEKMDLEIARVSREMYKAFNGLNEGFAEVFKLYQKGNDMNITFRPKTKLLLMS